MLIKAAQFFHHPFPAGPLVFDRRLKRRDCMRFASERNIFDGAGQQRSTFEAGFLREVAQNLEFRIQSRFQFSVKLEHQPVSIENGRIALLSRDPPDWQFFAGGFGQLCE